MGLLHKKDWGEHPHPLSVLVNLKQYGHQILFRREVLPLIHQFETYNVSYDSLVYTLCSSMGDVKYINQVLVHWRRHENASTLRADRQTRISCMVIILHYVLCTTTRSVKSAASIFVCINEFNLNLNRTAR